MLIRKSIWSWLPAMAVVAICVSFGYGETNADQPQDISNGLGSAPEVIIEKVFTEAVAGTPLGAGRIEVTYLDDHGPVIFPDQRLILEATDQRAHYATFNLDYQVNKSDSPYRVKRIEAVFLLKGDKTVEFTLHGPGGDLVDENINPVAENAGVGRRILLQWWEAFSEVPDGAESLEIELHEALLDVLAHRHGLPLPLRKTPSDRPVSGPSPDLEAHFERAVGMLFGIESVRLAMQDDVTLDEITREQTADQPVPRPPRMRSLQVPPYDPVAIERIAMRVPEECFYLRTGSLFNYFRFRDFLVGWGGSLSDIVSPRAFDRDMRRKIETQLGLNTSTVKVEQWDHLISDMAFIGSDPLFQDGAAVGVLIESDVSNAIINLVQQQRSEVRKQQPGANERRFKVRDRWVSVLSTSDNRLRSFYVIDGSYHFITNSEHLMNRFLSTADGGQSLGQLNEFGYARSKAKSDDSTRAFLYLSDPFFQNLICPQYRIEMTRRAAAKRALRDLQLASLLARVEGVTFDSVNDLVAARFLPKHFADRPDGSRAIFRGGRSIDTLRGENGTFLPVPDIPLQKATQAEVLGYQRFIADYNREWGRIDPVSIVFSDQENPKADGLRQVSLNIVVAPYARRRYALLDTHLADASSMKLTPVEGDLISVQAAVRLGPSSPAHLLSIGLQDDEVPFVLEHGQIKRIGEAPNDSFAESRSYAAITPPSTDVLRMLASVLLQGESPPPPTTNHTRTSSRQGSTPPPLPPMTPKSLQALYYMTWAFSKMPPGALGATKYLSMIETRDDITVAAKNNRIRDEILEMIARQRVADPHEVKLKISSLNGSKVAPYIQAYTYIDARRRSTQSAQLLNRWTEWLCLPPDRARLAVEDLLEARVCCPLGGRFVPEEKHSQFDWASTAWTESSRFELTEVPSDWEFPFLRWLQELDINFDLGPNTLTASINLTTHHHTVGYSDQGLFNGQNLIQADGNPDSQTSPGSRLSTQHSTSTDKQAVADWIMGVRVSEQNGVIRTSSVHPNSPASRAGVQRGDVIRRINDREAGSSEYVRQMVHESLSSGYVWLELERTGAKIRLRVAL